MSWLCQNARTLPHVLAQSGDLGGWLHVSGGRQGDSSCVVYLKMFQKETSQPGSQEMYKKKNTEQKRASAQAKHPLIYGGTCLLFSENKQPCYQADTDREVTNPQRPNCQHLKQSNHLTVCRLLYLKRMITLIFK